MSSPALLSGTTADAATAAAVENIRDFKRVYSTFQVVAGLGLLGMAFYAAASASDLFDGLSILGAAFVMGGASALVGGILGFLFAVPRSRQAQAAAPVAPRVATGDENGPPHRRLSDYAANTNLEQISDWLTKILVGAGLVELGEVLRILQEACDVPGAGATGSGGYRRRIMPGRFLHPLGIPFLVPHHAAVASKGARESGA